MATDAVRISPAPRYSSDVPPSLAESLEAYAQFEMALFRREPASLLARRDTAHSAFRAAVRSYVTELRTSGMPPGQVLVTMRALVRRIAPPQMPAWEVEVLTREAAAWSIEAYYSTARGKARPMIRRRSL
jgi:hypothetical protein